MNRETQIPLYRGKKIDSDEWVIGIFDGECRMLTQYDKTTIAPLYKRLVCYEYEIIDPSTLAIHFPDMLASDSDRLLPNGEKDLRVFASLSEDGKGGDKIKAEKTITPVIYKDCRIKSRYLDCALGSELLKGFKTIGIQQ